MTFISVIPPALLAKEEWENFVIFLQELPVPERRKKQILVEWTKVVGVALTKEMVDQVLGPLAERAR